MNRTDIEDAFRNYLDALYDPRLPKNGFIRRDHSHRLIGANSACDFSLGPFLTFAEEGIRALTGAINQARMMISRLAAWEQALSGISPRELRVGIGFELVEPLLELALVSSYNLKQRFVFLGTKAIMLSVCIRHKMAAQVLVEDHQIQLSTLKAWIDPSDQVHAHFLNSVAELDSRRHWDETRNFRRRAVHQLPPHLLFGLSSHVSIKKADNGYSINVGAMSPIWIEDVIPSLQDEHKKQRAAFLAFLNLARREREKLEASYPVTQASVVLRRTTA